MKRSILVLLYALVTSVCAAGPLDALKEEWKAFKLEHNKKYESEVADRFHLKVYAENKHKIARHNQRYERGEESFRLKPNRYADMLHHEFVATMNGYNSTARLKGGRGSSFIPPAHVSVPDEVDWREEGAVTAVKSQGKCGSCWAFSTTGSLEGQNWRKTGSLVPLSEQNLLDCTASFGNKGCRRGRMDNAFSYIRSNGGVDTEASYPYEGVADTCRYNAETVGAEDTGYVNIPPGDEDSLMQAVATVGPVSVAVDASTQTFQFYSDGVYYDESCSQDNLDHAVLVVGYGTDEAEGDYWLVKNSWGTSWGIYGYVKMARNRDNHCGVASAAVYPLV